MGKFIEIYSPLNLNQEVFLLNRPINRSEIESVIKITPTNKSLAPDGFTGEVYQSCKELNTDPSCKNFRGGKTPNYIL